MSGVYISYPFCSQKCTYCNFASGVFPRELEIAYTGALRRELAGADWPWTPDTIYLGGGTPSLLDPQALAPVLREVPLPASSSRSTLGVGTEATIEAAPGTITAEKAAAWRRMGINRVSLGVQSFIAAELARTGRKHTAELVEREIALLRGAGIESISLDLIAGLPGQTRESWSVSLDWLERLGTPHASIYMLEVDEDSRLGSEILALGTRYGAPSVPSDDLIAGFYETAVERLARAGLVRYEISNFARPGFESRHNLKYWRREPYLGFGADAHSFDGIGRWQNVESAAEYVDRMARGVSPVAERTPADPAGERFFLGLRLAEGIPWERGAPSFAEPDVAHAVERFLGEGLLETAGSRLRLTPRGVLLSNEVFAEFVGHEVTA